MLLHCHTPLSTLCATPHSFFLHPALRPCALPAPRNQSGSGAAGAAVLSGRRSFTQEENVEPIRDSVEMLLQTNNALFDPSSSSSCARLLLLLCSPPPPPVLASSSSCARLLLLLCSPPPPPVLASSSSCARLLLLLCSPPTPPVLASSSSALPPAPLLCQQVAMADVLRATAGWAAERRIGSGGFGDVYHGGSFPLHLPPFSPILFDLSSHSTLSPPPCLTPFGWHQINEMASKHHPHLVRLLGFCVDYDAVEQRMEQIAIYEFMPHGDLHHRLHGDDTGGHHRLHAHDTGDIPLVRSVLHTAPSLPSSLFPSPAFPVPLACAALPSFGVVVMELLTCKCVVMQCEDGSHINIKDWVEKQVERGDSASVVNGDLNAPHAVASKLVEISLSCVAKLVSNRPTMSHVLVELEALRRELMGGRQERVARQLDAQVQRASLDCSQLEAELEMIYRYGAHNN
ncbi:unnamed protein product [Closterium sp. Naga37s-1]|nr:unnamed protein product [Closterium sp. Naga37s-1]